MQLFEIALIAFVSVVAALIVLSCLSPGSQEKKQTTDPNAMLRATTSSVHQRAYRVVGKGQTAKNSATKDGQMVVYAGAGAAVAAAAVVASTGGCGGGCGGGGCGGCGAFASVVAALIVLSCLCPGSQEKKQTSEPNDMPSATTSSVHQRAYRDVEKGKTAKSSATKDGEMVVYEGTGADVATAVVVAGTSGCGGSGGCGSGGCGGCGG
ncbi:uncharacterized protein LOC132182013 [Corylus avellana]|uniref:uncharacterized protein LOC132182013 n=1 Tax=Corylus avellana TaxID=13451 RepID=UPI00286C3139|nr:uncharacterized protein LOC132182013 [Corylus avellana]